MRIPLLTIFLVLVFDQWLKLWVKMNFHYGEQMDIIPGWFELQFVENPGMAFGWVLPGAAGKLTLSIFRIVVVMAIGYYLWTLVKKKAHIGYRLCVALIIAGALGNIIDSAVYGLMFDNGAPYDNSAGYMGVATREGPGYAPFLMGNVVDMFHITKEIQWGNRMREIFPPVFNVADSSITLGIILILIFQRRFHPKKKEEVVEEMPSGEAGRF